MEPARPRSIQRVNLETERFLLTGLLPQFVGERHSGWLNDPDVAGPLNREVGRGNVEALRKEVATADGITRFYIGISDKAGEPIGFYFLQRDPLHRTLTFNVLIGEKRWWGERVVLETRSALLDHFFAERGVDKAQGTPLARNIPAVFNYKRQGWRLEGVLKGQCLAYDGKERLDTLQFGLLADEWQTLRRRQP